MSNCVCSLFSGDNMIWIILLLFLILMMCNSNSCNGCSGNYSGCGCNS